MSDTAGNDPRISMRLLPDQKALIVRGAEARGLSLTDFMLNAGLREAELALLERTIFELDPETFAHFSAILERPAQDKPQIRSLLAKNKERKWRLKR